MRKAVLLILVLAAAACSSSTAPGKAGDPSILVTNDLPSNWVYITWRDGQGIVGQDSVAPHTTSQCVRFLAQPDSAYWEAHVADQGGGSAAVTSPNWFNPADRPAWTLRAFDPGPILLQSDAVTAC